MKILYNLNTWKIKIKDNLRWLKLKSISNKSSDDYINDTVSITSDGKVFSAGGRFKAFLKNGISYLNAKIKALQKTRQLLPSHPHLIIGTCGSIKYYPRKLLKFYSLALKLIQVKKLFGKEASSSRRNTTIVQLLDQFFSRRVRLKVLTFSRDQGKVYRTCYL